MVTTGLLLSKVDCSMTAVTNTVAVYTQVGMLMLKALALLTATSGAHVMQHACNRLMRLENYAWHADTLVAMTC